MSDLGQICRICTGNCDLGVCLLDPSQQRYASEISQSLNLQISADNCFPTKVCMKCFQICVNWLSLKDVCKISHTVLCQKLNLPHSAGLLFGVYEQKEEQHNFFLDQKPPTNEANNFFLAGQGPSSELSQMNSELLVVDVDLHSMSQDESSAQELDQTEQDMADWDNPSEEEEEDLGAVEQDFTQAQHSQNTLQNPQILGADDYGNVQLPPLMLDCQICGKKMLDSHMRAHMRRSHNLDKSEINKYYKPEMFKCHYCGKSFQRRGLLNTHLRSHTLPFICEVCHKGFPAMSHLRDHALMHGESNYTCELCNKKFKRAKCLRSHVRVHKLENYNCEKCKLQFRFKTDFLCHNCTDTDDSNGCKCNICGKIYSSKKSLFSHNQMVHIEAKFSCTKCDSKFKLKSALKSHLEAVHCDPNDVDNWKCDVCGKGFKTQRYLGQHKSIAHTEPKYECKTCKRKFRLRENLKVHIQTIHGSGERTFKCNLCVSAFKVKTGLKRHLRAVHKVELSKNIASEESKEENNEQNDDEDDDSSSSSETDQQ